MLNGFLRYYLYVPKVDTSPHEVFPYGDFSFEFKKENIRDIVSNPASESDRREGWQYTPKRII